MNKPTAAEMDVLRILWDKGESTVKQVNEELNKGKKVGYTTTLKIMQLMLPKGLVSRRELGRSHIYKAEIEQSKVQNHLIDQLMETAFGGSASELVLNALGRTKASKTELDEIKALIKKLEKDA